VRFGQQQTARQGHIQRGRHSLVGDIRHGDPKVIVAERITS